MLRSDLCVFSDAYIVVKGTITLGRENNANKRNTRFMKCISKTNGTKIDNAEDLDVVMLMYNLIEYTKNYRKSTGSLWNYYRDEPSNPLSSNSGSFKYNTKITRKIPDNSDALEDIKVVVPLKIFLMKYKYTSD